MVKESKGQYEAGAAGAQGQGMKQQWAGDGQQVGAQLSLKPGCSLTILWPLQMFMMHNHIEHLFLQV